MSLSVDNQHQSILIASSLDQIYTQVSVCHQSKRWIELIKSFERNYSHRPTFVARAPGRVNIIGEHIDYSGFSVLPSAIEPDLLIACSVVYDQSFPTSNNQSIQVQAKNLNPAYPELSFEYDLSSQIPIGKGGWSDYLKSAFNICLEHFKTSSSSDQLRLPSSIKLLIDGTVPAGSGLSSSAALTTASTLVVLYIHQLDKQVIAKSLVPSLAIAAEQACGISVGGMDQTASVFGQPDKLLHIEFTPTTSVIPLEFPKLPPTTFVIANSLVTSKKLDSSKEQYNLRVVECRMVTRMLSDRLLITSQIGTNPKNLRELVELYCPRKSIPDAIQVVLDQLISHVDKLGGIAGLSRKAVLENLQMSEDQFEAEILRGMVVEPKDGLFKPYHRARHVLTEAQRVYKLRELLEKADTSSDPEQIVVSIGQLMNQSQASCRDDYDCSCEALDELMSIARSNGSLGSRLTGAGWGGSSVHLVRDEQIESLIEAFKSQYYSIRFPDRFLDGGNTSSSSHQDFSKVCFPTKPQGGACLVTQLEALLD